MANRVTFARTFGAALSKTHQRLATDFGAPFRSLTLSTSRIEPFKTSDAPLPYGEKTIGLSLLNGDFTYAGQTMDVSEQKNPWIVPAPSERFAFWLHSFNWLPHLAHVNDQNARVKARFLVDGWIDEYGSWNSYAWDNDILANRLLNWLQVWPHLLTDDNLSDLAMARRINTVRQLKRLRGTFKRTPVGLSRLKAASALCLGGLLMHDKADGFLNRGLDYLNDEIEAQILPDGGHISRNPSSSLASLSMLSHLKRSMDEHSIDAGAILDRAITRLTHAIPFFQASDGGLACFNGGGEDSVSRIKQALKLSPTDPQTFSYGPHVKYQRVAQGHTVIIMDAGQTSPTPFDEDAHLSPLAIEISTGAGRLIVNCGWSEEQPQIWRENLRGTAAHSTLILKNQSAGELLSQGLAAKTLGRLIKEDVGMVSVTRKEQQSGILIEGAHNGYVPQTGLSHRRRIYVDPTGLDIRGEDSLMVPIGGTPLSRDAIPFDIRFHLHPSVRATLARDLQSALLIQSGQEGWRFRTDGGPMKIEDSVYLGRGSKPVKTQQIVISGVAYADSDGETSANRVRWSLRRLDGQT